MDVDDEIRQYLRLLLDHSIQCHDEGCPSHVQLREICGMHPRTDLPRRLRESTAAGYSKRVVSTSSKRP